MSPPSINPTTVFRWEDSSALEHSCWACSTKSNSPRAVHTCYGIHSIPCMAYHSTMHAVGTAHRCSGCATSREMHDSRHREIARLVAEYRAADFVLETPLRRRALAPHAENTQLQNVVQVDEHFDNEDVLSGDEEWFSGQETISTSTGNENHGPLKLTKAEQRECKRKMKTEKSIQKAARNECRHTLKITTEDVKKIEVILHGSQDQGQSQRHPLATDQTIDDVIARNLGFVKQIQSHKLALYESIRIGRKEQEERKRAKKRITRSAEYVETEAVIDAILVELGIENVNEARTKKRKSTLKSKPSTKKSEGRDTGPKARIVAKLREAVRDDLEKHENDLRQTYIRAGGFFRYAGKVVFDRMTEIAKTIDLLTGEEWEKKRKREAQAEAEAQEQGEDDGNEADDEE